MSGPEMTRMVNIGVVAGGTILVLRRAETDSLPGYWEIPGGGVEVGESFEDAARRELVEETGIRASPLVQIHYQRGPAPPGFRRPLLELTAYRLNLPTRPTMTVLSEEHSAFQWVAGEGLANLRMMDLNRSLARLALARVPSP
jgi:8-oxo-dGTP pyrophosphatase MutT (NUDIX family)